VDQLGALAFLRVPLIIKWVVSVYVIASPVFIAWQYNVHVTSMFRVKFLFTQYPWTLLLLIFCSALLSGMFVMRHAGIHV